MADAEAGGGGGCVSCLKLSCSFLKIYWKGIFCVVWPLAMLPVFLLDNEPAMRCLYVVIVMAGLWITEALPLGVTALIPMICFPTMGILDSDKTSYCYMKETNMMFIGGLIIAIAVEHCNLHKRIALSVMKCIGCSPRRLHLGLCSVTCLISMWISNTAAAAMMLPIVEATLTELEEQKIVKVYENRDGPSDPNFDQGTAIPTRSTIAYYLSIAYAATIGGVGTIIGTGTNLTFKGIYEARFPDATDQASFTTWLIIGVPVMICCIIPTIIAMQILYLGMCRPNSKDAQAVKVGPEGREVAYKVIEAKLNEMGRMSFHEIGVAFFFTVAVLLWFFRNPQFMPGWPEQITDMKVKDATPAIFVCVMMYFVPAQLNFIYHFTRDAETRPKEASPALLTWKVVNTKMPWGLVFLLGGGFALAEGSKASGMSDLIGKKLAALAVYPRLVVLFMIIMIVTFITQIFSSNVAVSNIVLPVIAEMSVAAEWHPMFLMMPATFACSFAYTLPISTPPNALVADPCNLPTVEMIKAGTVIAIICALVLFALFPVIMSSVFDMKTFPVWASAISSTVAPTTTA